jgi:hypothetical protein
VQRRAGKMEKIWAQMRKTARTRMEEERRVKMPVAGWKDVSKGVRD